MNAVIHAAAIYLFLLVLFRLAGRRTLSEMTNFDFILLLIIGEATQQALLGDDFSVVNAFVVIMALVVLDVLFSLAQARSGLFAKITNGVPMIIVEYGKPLYPRMRRARVGEDDVLQSARSTRGLERMDQIKFAILEVDGTISVIPYEHGHDADSASQRKPVL